MDLSQGLTPYVLLYSLAMGLISFASPCILPLIPSYVSYITGISYDELVSRESRRKNIKITLLHSLAFVGGFSLVFVLLGATASLAGSLLSRYLDVIRVVGGVLIIIMGVFVMDVINIPFLQQEAKVHLKNRPAGFIGTLVVGMIFGAGLDALHGPLPRLRPCACDDDGNPGTGHGAPGLLLHRPRRPLHPVGNRDQRVPVILRPPEETFQGN